MRASVVKADWAGLAGQEDHCQQATTTKTQRLIARNAPRLTYREAVECQGGGDVGRIAA
jgi:hypothetical protein